MTLDEVKKRFVEEVKLRAYDDKYIDRTEEREILQIAQRRGSLAIACRHVAGTPRQTDTKWLHVCQSTEATS